MSIHSALDISEVQNFFSKAVAEAQEDVSNDLGCVYASYIYYGYRNLCVGSLCGYNNNCNSGCCSGYGGACQYSDWCDDVNLAWLWWTLASVCLVLCIVSMILGAKRRRR